jgi:hypothetical protein
VIGFLADVDQLGLSDQKEMIKLVTLLQKYPRPLDIAGSSDPESMGDADLETEFGEVALDDGHGIDPRVLSVDNGEFANHKFRVWTRGMAFHLANAGEAIPFLRRW